MRTKSIIIEYGGQYLALDNREYHLTPDPTNPNVVHFGVDQFDAAQEMGKRFNMLGQDPIYRVCVLDIHCATSTPSFVLRSRMAPKRYVKVVKPMTGDTSGIDVVMGFADTAAVFGTQKHAEDTIEFYTHSCKAKGVAAIDLITEVV